MHRGRLASWDGSRHFEDMKNKTFGEVENNLLLKNNGKLKIVVNIEKSGIVHAFLQSCFSSPCRTGDRIKGGMEHNRVKEIFNAR